MNYSSFIKGWKQLTVIKEFTNAKREIPKSQMPGGEGKEAS